MIKIVTSKGVSLDLAPDAEFVIEYNNPMMEDDRIPVPFSTDIALLPSETNCKTLGYLPAFKLEPTVREIAVSLVLDGIPFLKGTLSYSGIEDGRLNYTFAGKDIEDEWGKKLYDLEIMQYNILEDGTKELNDGVFYPTLVNKEFTGYFDNGDAIASDFVTDGYITPKTEKINKYKNPYKDSPQGIAAVNTTAVSLCQILPESLQMDYKLLALVKNMAVIAPYKQMKIILPDNIPTGATIVVRKNIDFGPMLPEMTISEFVAEFMKIFCAAVFRNGDAIDLWTFEDIAALAASGDWSDRVADEFSSEVEPATGYVFGYDNSGESSPDVTEYEEADSVARSLYVSRKMVAAGSGLSGFKTTRIQTTGDYISSMGGFVKCYRDNTDQKGIALVATADILFQNNLKQMNTVEGRDSSENICGFSLVKCTPCILNWVTPYTSGNGADTPAFAYAPVIEFQNKEADRGSDVYIGLMVNSQLTDSGRAMPSTVPDLTLDSDGQPVVSDSSLLADVTFTPDGWNEPVSLRPDWLYEHFHKSYAAWLAKDRQLLSCDVKLTAEDLMNFRLHHKVLIHGREFFVKKLSVTIRADASRPECSAEFISA